MHYGGHFAKDARPTPPGALTEVPARCVQGTGEARPMTRAEVEAMIVLAEKGCNELFAAQRKAIG